MIVHGRQWTVLATKLPRLPVSAMFVANTKVFKTRLALTHMCRRGICWSVLPFLEFIFPHPIPLKSMYLTLRLTLLDPESRARATIVT